MYESILSAVVLGVGMFLWNVFETRIFRLIDSHFEKRSKDEAVFIDPR